MKYSVAAATLLASMGAAQDISDLPSCALPCILSAVQETSCEVTDLECICAEYDSLRSNVIPCLETESQCETNEIQAIVDGVQDACEAEGATVGPTASVTESSLEDMPQISDAPDTVTESLPVTETESLTSTETTSDDAGATGGSGDDDGGDDAEQTGGEGGDDAEALAGRVSAAGFGLAAAFAAAIVL